MNTDEHLLRLMSHVEGESEGSSDNDTRAEIMELKNTIAALKALPLAMPDPGTDDKVLKFLAEKEQHSPKLHSINQWLPYVLVAASLAMLLYVFLPKNLAQRYDLMDSNPDRISFIHELNTEELSREELLWLVSLLEFEEHPNIRVIILDVLQNQGAALPAEFARSLVTEGSPAVQMAFLNTLEGKYLPEMKNELMAFNARKDLDPIVRDRVSGILINK